MQERAGSERFRNQGRETRLRRAGRKGGDRRQFLYAVRAGTNGDTASEKEVLGQTRSKDGHQLIEGWWGVNRRDRQQAANRGLSVWCCVFWVRQLQSRAGCQA